MIKVLFNFKVDELNYKEVSLDNGETKQNIRSNKPKLTVLE